MLAALAVPVSGMPKFQPRASFRGVFITSSLLSSLPLTWWQPCKFESLPYDEYEPLSVLPVDKREDK